MPEAGRPAGFSAGSRFPWYLALLMVGVFFSTSVIMAYRSVGVMATNNRSVSDTLYVLTLIHQLRSQFYAVESGKRGFLLTKNEAYLQPYEDGLQQLQDLLGLLRTATRQIPGQNERFNELYPVALQRLDGMSESVHLIRRQYDDTALALIDTDKGIRLMNALMAVLQDMEDVEYAVLEQKRNDAYERRSQLLLTLIATNSIGLLLTLVTFFFAYRHTRRVAELNERVEKANSELESQVEVRTQVLAQYADELKRSNRELEDFAFVASHDLQEPLRKIRAFGDRLQKTYGGELGEKGSDYINRMRSASERMSVLINDILSFSRVTSRQKPFERVDLNGVVRSVLGDLEFVIKETEAEVVCAQLPEIDADPSQLSQVFANLINNSIKFRVPDRTPQIRINVAATASPLEDDTRDWIQLTLSDNGIGFDPQYRDRVFNIFQRLHAHERYKGTGIGLALCRKIIERHGGTISADSQQDQGSIFTILLPATQINLDTTSLG